MHKVKAIQRILNRLYPDPKVPLRYDNIYTLLVAVILSAQCTDSKVNTVTPILFSKAGSPEEMAELSLEEIEKILKPLGLYRSKAKAIKQMSQQLIEQYHSEVPDNFEDLESLSGVGHKTASVIMSHAFGKLASPVDTHIHRCAKRWGLSEGKNVKQTEKDLKRLFKKEDWGKLHLQIIYFGREYCTARGHDVNKCPICKSVLHVTKS